MKRVFVLLVLVLTMVNSVPKKLNLRFLGHSGFKLQFPDPKDKSVTRTIYIDTWPDNSHFPDSARKELNDADLLLVTHGHSEHSSGTPKIFFDSMNNKKSPKIGCIFELSHYFSSQHKIPMDCICPMNKGGPVDFGF